MKMSNEYKEWRENYELEIKEFVKKYCQWCGTQRCEGPGTEWANGCPHWIKEFEEPYETANNRAKRP